MAEVLDLDTQQNLIKDAILRGEERHNRYRAMELLFRTGSFRQAMSVARRTGELAEYLPDLDEHVSNMVLPHISIIEESIVARDPRLICEPLAGGEEAETNKVASEGVISYFWKRSRATDRLREASRDMVRLGIGFMKVAWTHLESDEELEGREEAIETGVEELRLQSVLNGELFNRDNAIKLLEDSIPISQTRVIRSEPFVSYVSPFDLFVPVNARSIEEADWVCHRVSLPIDQIVANPEYGVTRDDIIPDGHTTKASGTSEYEAEWRRQTDDARAIEGSTKALDTATIYEFYDMRDRKLTVFQIDGLEPLWSGDLPWDHRYPPFVEVKNYRTTGYDFWGFGDIENIANLQDMLNEFLSEQLQNARRSGQRYIVRKTAVTEELRVGLEEAEFDVVIPVNLPSGEPLSDVISPIFRQPLSADVYNAKAEIEDKIRQVLGINDFQAGGLGADRMSATAAAVVDGVATLRAQSKIASVEAAASQVGNIMLLLCQQYLDEPTVIRIARGEGISWQPVSSEDLFGEFLVSVEGGSTRAINPATREQQGLRTVAEIVPILVQLGYDPEPALRMGLRDLGYDPDTVLVRAQQQPGPMVPPQQESQAAPTTSEEIMAMGGPSLPAEMQGRGGIAV